MVKRTPQTQSPQSRRTRKTLDSVRESDGGGGAGAAGARESRGAGEPSGGKGYPPTGPGAGPVTASATEMMQDAGGLRPVRCYTGTVTLTGRLKVETRTTGRTSAVPAYSADQHSGGGQPTCESIGTRGRPKEQRADGSDRGQCCGAPYRCTRRSSIAAEASPRLENGAARCRRSDRAKTRTDDCYGPRAAFSRKRAHAGIDCGNFIAVI